MFWNNGISTWDDLNNKNIAKVKLKEKESPTVHLEKKKWAVQITVMSKTTKIGLWI